MTIESLLLAYQLPAIFLGSFFFGETVILAAAFIAGQGTWSLSAVFWLSFAGTLISDVLWFLFGQWVLKKTGSWQKQRGKYAQVMNTLERHTGRRPFFALLFMKFLYGTRILTIVYLSIRNISLSTFLLFDAIGTLIWLTSMVGAGYLAGKGVAYILPTLNAIQYALLALVLLLLMYKGTTLWVEKKLNNK